MDVTKAPLKANVGSFSACAVATARVYVVGEALEAIITFAPLGASKEADEVCALAKFGVIGAISVGFRPVSRVPIRGGGERFTATELLEISLVSIPCDSDALVIARSMQGQSGRVLNGKNAAALQALIRCLGRSESAHADGLEMLDEADRHRKRAAKHAGRIAASQDGGDEDDPNDDDSDNELAYQVERRKREIEIASKAPTVSRDAARRARAIEVARLAHSA